jgi:hypothetical protein
MSFRSFVTSALFLASASIAGPVWATAQHAPVYDGAKKEQPSPDWFADNGRAALALLDLVETSHVDGLDPAVYRPVELRRALQSALQGSHKARAKASLRFSEVRYQTAEKRRSASGPPFRTC